MCVVRDKKKANKMITIRTDPRASRLRRLEGNKKQIGVGADDEVEKRAIYANEWCTKIRGATRSDAE